MSTDNTGLVIAEIFAIAGRGTAIFFVDDPKPWWSRAPHHVRVMMPDGSFFETVALVEFARKIPPGEVMSLVFPDKEPGDLVLGAHVTSLGIADFEREIRT
jgi:hypothetical protein